jgi:hypothetical protein
VYASAERADTLPLFLLYPYMYSAVYSIKQLQEHKKERPCDKFKNTKIIQFQTVRLFALKNEGLRNSQWSGKESSINA